MGTLLKTTPVIELKNVQKRFGTVWALEDVTLSVLPGKIHGFLGPNGAGKTTTIKLLMDFIRPTKGSVQVFGMDAHTHSSELKKRIGYLSGDFEMYGNLTGGQYLTYIANLRGVTDRGPSDELCEELGAVLTRPIGTLSRGNKQKIGLVAAMMGDPDLLILDEPTTGLDPLMQQKFYDVIRRHAERGKTVFMSSHIISEIQEACDIVTFMKRGKVTQTVATEELLAANKRQVVMTYADSTEPVVPPQSLGATDMTQTAHRLEFNVVTADKKLLSWIAEQPVKDVTITEANLEAVFLSLYKEDIDV